MRRGSVDTVFVLFAGYCILVVLAMLYMFGAGLYEMHEESELLPECSITASVEEFKKEAERRKEFGDSSYYTVVPLKSICPNKVVSELEGIKNSYIRFLSVGDTILASIEGNISYDSPIREKLEEQGIIVVSSSKLTEECKLAECGRENRSK